MNRNPFVGLIAAGMVFVPLTASAAPPEAQVSVDEIVCRYSNECPEAVPPETDAEPPTRGFSFQPARKPTVSSQPTVTPKAKVVAKPSAPKSVARVTPRPTIAVSKNDLLISFGNNSAELTSQARANATVFAQALMTPQLKDKRFLIAGHTNATGSRELNLELSRKRAEAVAAFLEAQGVERDRLRLRGFGFDEPLPGRTPAAPSNRRVEATVIEGN